MSLPSDFSGLVCWLKADLGVTTASDGSPVSLWSDQSTAHNDAGTPPQGSSPVPFSPTYVQRTSVPYNGLGVVRFALPQTMNGRIFFAPTTSGQAYTIIAVFATPSVADQNVVCDASGPANWSIGVKSGNVICGPAGALTSQSVPVTPGNIFRCCATGNGVVSQFYVNGLPETTNSAPVPNCGVGVLGEREATPAPFYGDLLEVIVYSRVLLDAERQAVDLYLFQKWTNNATASLILSATASATAARIPHAYPVGGGATLVLTGRVHLTLAGSASAELILTATGEVNHTGSAELILTAAAGASVGWPVAAGANFVLMVGASAAPLANPFRISQLVVEVLRNRDTTAQFRVSQLVVEVLYAYAAPVHNFYLGTAGATLILSAQAQYVPEATATIVFSAQATVGQFASVLLYYRALALKNASHLASAFGFLVFRATADAVDPHAALSNASATLIFTAAASSTAIVTVAGSGSASLILSARATPARPAPKGSHILVPMDVVRAVRVRLPQVHGPLPYAHLVHAQSQANLIFGAQATGLHIDFQAHAQATLILSARAQVANSALATLLLSAQARQVGPRSVLAGASLIFRARASARFPEVVFAQDYLGRFEQGQELPLWVIVRDQDGVPTDPTTMAPLARIYNLDTMSLAGSARLAQLRDSRVSEVYTLALRLDTAYPVGRYGVLIQAATGGFTGVDFAVFEVVPGGDPGGPVVAATTMARSTGDLILANLDSGKLLVGERPSVQ